MRHTDWHLLAIGLLSRCCLAHGEEFSLVLENILPREKAYNKVAAPKQGDGAAVVKLTPRVLSVDAVDEKEMTVRVQLELEQSWTDHRLRLPDDIQSTSVRHLPLEWLEGGSLEIWKPDTHFTNANIVREFQYLLLRPHDKTFLHMKRLTLSVRCPMDLTKYPHDHQVCKLQIQSLSHTTEDLIFEWEEPTYDNDTIATDPKIELTNSFTDECSKSSSRGNFTCLEVVLAFQRRSCHFLIHVYAPTYALVVLSWIHFWVKPEEGAARVLPGLAALVLLAVFHRDNQDGLPQVSYAKAIDVFVLGCSMFVFLSLVEYSLVNYVMSLNQQPTKKKECLIVTDGENEETSASCLPEMCRSQYEKCLTIDKISRILFPLSFLVLNLIYWFVLLGEND